MLYKLKVLLHPSHWVRMYPENKEWDEQLWLLLENNPVDFVGKNSVTINNFLVSISGDIRPSGAHMGELSDSHRSWNMSVLLCSRATNLLLHEKVQAAKLFSNLKYPGILQYWDLPKFNGLIKPP